MERQVNIQVVHRMVHDLLSNPRISPWLNNPEPITNISIDAQWMQHCVTVETSVLVDSSIIEAQCFTKPPSGTEQPQEQSSSEFDRPEKLELVCHKISGNIAYITMLDVRIPLSFTAKRHQQYHAALSSNIHKAVAQYKDNELYFYVMYHLQDGGAILVVKIYSMHPVISSHQYMVVLSSLSSPNEASNVLGFAILKEQQACKPCLNLGQIYCNCSFQSRKERGEMPKLRPPPQVVYGDSWQQLAWCLCKYDTDMKKYQIYIHHGKIQSGWIHQQTRCIYDGPCGDYFSKDAAYFLGSVSTYQQELAKLIFASASPPAQIYASPSMDTPTPRSTERPTQDEPERGGYVKVKSEHGMTSIPKSMKALLNFDSGQLADGTQMLLTTSDFRLPPEAPKADIQDKRSELDHTSTPSSKTKKERDAQIPAAASVDVSISRGSHGGENKSGSDESSISASSHPDSEERNRIVSMIRLLDREKWTGGSCKICSQPFSRKHDLKRHIKTIHLRERSFKCNSCESKFKRRQHLESHVKTVHEKSSSFVCDRCGKVFTADSTRRRHLRTIHGSDLAGPSGSGVEAGSSPRISLPSGQNPAKSDAVNPKQDVVVGTNSADLPSQTRVGQHAEDITEQPHPNPNLYQNQYQLWHPHQSLSQVPPNHSTLVPSVQSPYQPLPPYDMSSQFTGQMAWHPASDTFLPAEPTSYAQAGMIQPRMYQGPPPSLSPHPYPLPPPSLFNIRPSEHTAMPVTSHQNQQLHHDGNLQQAGQQGQQVRPPWPEDDKFRSHSNR
eukprot:CAMPEP_0184706852 /NCGR_PEP_ID=MMETSP0313-20130426/36975_1 /TAXON_ID=2792 /ORGANISM="Porphyridium aerugineum, Strain SAG 1380-2" /LENGTH=780 /DNA_ID=CAMNT_0027168419 /DNA_START=711 /DNA_END=3053 /DNA_ORIENTATION=-